MKKNDRSPCFRSFFAAAALSAAVAIASVAAAQGPNLLSQAALIVDARTGDPIFAKNANNVTPIASITKLMTAMVVLDAQQNLDQTLTVDLDDLDFEGQPLTAVDRQRADLPGDAATGADVFRKIAPPAVGPVLSLVDCRQQLLR